MNEGATAIDGIELAVAALPDDGLAEARQAALRHFKRRGFPTSRDEDWKYTDLAEVIDISRRAITSRGDIRPADPVDIPAPFSSLDAAWIVIANGEIVDALSSGLRESDIDVSPLQPDPDGTPFDDPLSDLNLALLRQGISIRIRGDRIAQRPVGLLVMDSTNGAAGSSQVRIDISLDRHAGARFIECHTSFGDDPHYSNTVINLAAGENSRTEYLRYQVRATDDSQTQRLNVRLDRDSSFKHGSVDLGGRLTRNDLKIDMMGPGSSATFDGLYVVGDGQHVDNHTRVDHRVPNTTSRQEYRGILTGRSRAVWNGKAIVHRGADGTDAQQANHNLLLSAGAEIDAKPELEIYADEVKCAHGTTVGELDEKALFYLRSRGIELERARRILTRAFAVSVVHRLPIAELREPIGDAVEQRLRDIADGALE